MAEGKRHKRKVFAYKPSTEEWRNTGLIGKKCSAEGARKPTASSSVGKLKPRTLVCGHTVLMLSNQAPSLDTYCVKCNR